MAERKNGSEGEASRLLKNSRERRCEPIWVGERGVRRECIELQYTTDEQQRSRPKSPQPFGRQILAACGFVALSSKISFNIFLVRSAPNRPQLPASPPREFFSSLLELILRFSPLLYHFPMISGKKDCSEKTGSMPWANTGKCLLVCNF